MSKPKKLRVSIFMVILTIILLLSVIITLSMSFMFSSGSNSAKLFSNYIYLMTSKEMEPEIPYQSAVFADSDDIKVLTEGNVVLCNIDKGREAVLRITEVVHNTDSTVYRVAGDATPNNIIDVDKNDIIAKCTIESKGFGSIINFIISTKGIIIFLILPCVILLIMLIAKIISAKKYYTDDEANIQSDEYEDYEEYDNDLESDVSQEKYEKSNYKKTGNPLFEPSMNIKNDVDFERKKSSIAQNFAQKSNSVPPKRKNELRTKYTDTYNQENSDLVREIAEDKKYETRKISPAAVENFKAAVNKKPSASVTRQKSAAKVNPEVNEKMAAIKAALNQTKENDNLASQINNKPRKTTVPAASSKTSVKKKNDNINSIDDLIKALEEEKKKL